MLRRYDAGDAAIHASPRAFAATRALIIARYFTPAPMLMMMRFDVIDFDVGHATILLMADDAAASAAAACFSLLAQFRCRRHC